MSDARILFGMVTSLLARTVELERRSAGSEFYGTVKEVDGAKQAVRVVIGETPEGDEVLSPWTKVAQTSGAMGIHDLPSVGQQVTVIPMNGDIEMGKVQPLHWSKNNPAISDDPNVKVAIFGDVMIELKVSGLSVTVGGTVFSLTADGINGVGNTDFEGGHLHHKGTNVGDDHVHLGVEPGSDKSGKPE